MRWLDLVRGHARPSRPEVPRSYSGRLLLQRLGPDALGIRDPDTGRSLPWDDDALAAMGVSIVEVRPTPGSEAIFEDGSAPPGAAVTLSLRRRSLLILDEDAATLGEARAAELAIEQLDHGLGLRGIVLRELRDLSGRRTGLWVLTAPEGIHVEIREGTSHR